MKISLRHLFLCAAAAVGFSADIRFRRVFAQDNSSATPILRHASRRPPHPRGGTIGRAGGRRRRLPATPAAGARPTQARHSEPQPAAEPSEPPKLRRLDSDEDSDAPKTHKEMIHERIERAHQRHANRVNRDIVNVFSSSELPKDEKADNVVAIFGSSSADGEVVEAVVSVFGNSRAAGPVGDAVVAVLGDSEVTGPVGDSTVVVLGNLSINSHVHGDVVAVLGDIKFGPAAVVDGEVVCVGGTVTRSVGTVLHHGVQNVGMGSMHGAAGLKVWVRECLLYGRPLAFAPHLMWAWWIALGLLAFYFLLALIFGKGVTKCTETFEQRPGYSILAALLTVLLAPIAIILLVFTGVGIAVVPFLAAGIFFATLFGKAVMLAWIGRRFTKFTGSYHPALATLIGGVIVLLLYTVPVLGFILYKLLGWIGLGVVVYTLMLGMKREKAPVAPVPPPAPGPAAVEPVAPVDPVTGVVPPAVGAAALVPAAPPVILATTLPRAGFWIRLAALLLDLLIVAMICSLLSEMFSSGSHIRIKADLLPSLALYGVLMWKLRGSTVGGIVCGLKVIRLDDRPIDWGTAIVRALSCFLSLFVLGFGFSWVAFDEQRQSWHDKIAGTTVVRVPKGVSLV